MTAALAAVLDQLDESGDQTDKEALAEEKPRPLSPYRRLAAVHATEFSASKPVHAVKLKLQGDMMRYLWTFDGKTLDEAASIKIKRGEIVRVEILNNSMMHHPVHLHGHFFRVLLGKGRYSPLKHTLDLPPMSKRIIEFDATESGDWIFHCHVLYHMMAGMSRVFSYAEPGESHQPQIAPEERNPWHFSSEASFESQMSMGMATLMNTRNNLNLVWDVGYERIMTMQDAPTAMGKDNMKMPRAGLREERTPGLEYEIDATWSRYLTPRWSAFGGWRFTNKIDSTDRAILGVSHLLPFNVDSAVSVDSEGDFRFTLAKRLQITDRLTAFGQVEYDTNMPWMWMSGLTWTLNHQFSLLTHYDSDYGLGAGLSVRF
jgi:uncharacterized cupredoxin-like copper-binding protein